MDVVTEKPPIVTRSQVLQSSGALNRNNATQPATMTPTGHLLLARTHHKCQRPLSVVVEKVSHKTLLGRCENVNINIPEFITFLEQSRNLSINDTIPLTKKVTPPSAFSATHYFQMQDENSVPPPPIKGGTQGDHLNRIKAIRALRKSESDADTYHTSLRNNSSSSSNRYNINKQTNKQTIVYLLVYSSNIDSNRSTLSSVSMCRFAGRDHFSVPLNFLVSFKSGIVSLLKKCLPLLNFVSQWRCPCALLCVCPFSTWYSYLNHSSSL